MRSEADFIRWGLAGLIGGMAAIGGARDASAAQTLRYQVDQRGDFVLLGNTLGHDCVAATPAPVVGTVGNCGANTAESGVDVLWRSEQPGAGQAQANNTITVANARSTALLSIPAGATVTKAYLYWGATRSAADPDDTITFDRPGGFTQAITADQTYTAANNSYQGVKDVTSIVQDQGPGAYRVSGVDVENPIDLNDDTTFVGWWMAVFYQRPSDPPRNLALFDGLDIVSNGNPVNTNLSGFLVPPAFGTAKLGIVAFEGDTTITGDQFFFNGGAALTDGLNPANNFFNRTRSTFGAATTVVGDLPQLNGQSGSYSGMDMDIVDITSKLTVGQTSAPISATSTGDVYWLAGFVTSVPTFKPDFSTSEKTAVDLNGGSLLPGDIVEYTIVATNNGNDTSVNTVMTDAIPMGVTYVPGSISITAGPNAGPKTDTVADDQGEYDSAMNTVRVRIGTGANGTMGGTVLIGESSTIKFRVTINADASGMTINNQAIIRGAGQQGFPAIDTPTDGNGAAAGQPPTPIVIDACQDDSKCMAPTPYCKIAADPNICVACLNDSHCGGSTQTCDLGMNTCVCVPSGMEICDGKDNDCNGQIDDGFNIGTACTVGVGACATSGVVACADLNSSACKADPGSPSNEVCDNIDNDCDGAVDDGNPGGGMSCMTGLPGICSAGITKCTAGALGCISNKMPIAETCDGVDQDCDGSIDDGFNLGNPCSVGVGACATMGVVVCTPQGAATCSAVAGQPAPAELCGDAIDNDCNGVADDTCMDSDGDGIADSVEMTKGTDPNDADSDDDGVLDGNEQYAGEDTDADGIINALDPDSDNDGLFDGTELGLDCSNPATDTTKNQCIADADMGTTTTSPVDPDTDDGGASDGAEDINMDGAVDANETDPNNPKDDLVSIDDNDSDGVTNAFDNCPNAPNTPQSDEDGDGIGDACDPDPLDAGPLNPADFDNDGTPNALDNCPYDPNPEPVDTDGDGLGDACDADRDDDDIPNELDACPLDPRPSCPHPMEEVSGCACIAAGQQHSFDPSGVWLFAAAVCHEMRRRARTRRPR